VKQTDHLAFDDTRSAFEEGFVMSRPRSRHIAFAVNRLDLLLRSGRVVGYPVYFDVHLTGEDRGGDHAVTGVANAIGAHRSTPTELTSHRDLPGSLGVAGQQSGRPVLVGENERHTEPPGHLEHRRRLLRFGNAMEAGQGCETGHVAPGVEVDHNVHVGPDTGSYEIGDAVRDPGERLGTTGFVDEGSVEVDTVGAHTLPAARTEGRRTQDGNQHDPPGHR